MFSIEEITEILSKDAFVSDYQWVRQSLLSNSVRQDFLFTDEIVARLEYFVESVLTSVTDWPLETGLDILKIAGEIAEVLSNYPEYPERLQKRLRLRSVLLYELSGMPAIAMTVLKPEDFLQLGDFLTHKGGFSKLNGKDTEKEFFKDKGVDFLELALSSDALNLFSYIQGEKKKPDLIQAFVIGKLAEYITFDLKASDIFAYCKVLTKRIECATISNVNIDLVDSLRKIGFPSELWDAQVEAINKGLLDQNYDSWGLAAPTGTGKTFLTRLLIIDELRKKPDSKIIYLVPTRALVYEVSCDLMNTLGELEISVMAVNAQLSQFNLEEKIDYENASVVILTPEKADLLLRIGQIISAEVGLVIVDEAHHIEADTRGVLLELYLWRLKKLTQNKARFVFLSAVTPNINQLAEWMGNKPGGTIFDRRSTRMRAGVYKIRQVGNVKEGWIEYSDKTSIRVVEKDLELTQRRGLVQLCHKLHLYGPILVVAKGKKECESLAVEMKDWLTINRMISILDKNERSNDTFMRLDSRLEREMYPSVEMRNLILNRDCISPCRSSSTC